MNYWNFQRKATTLEEVFSKNLAQMPNDYIIEPIKKVLNKKKPVMLEEQILDEVPQELEEETNEKV